METIYTEKLDLFSLPPYNTAEEKIYYENLPPAHFNKDSYSAVTFHIEKQPTDYIDLSKTELHVQLSLKKLDGTPLDTKDAKESIVPIDIILHNMWSSVEISLNKKLVSSSGTDYPYKSTIETYLNYGQAAKKHQLFTIGYSGENGTAPQATYPISNPINNGLKTRCQWFGLQGRDKSVEFIGPLNADICNQNRLILNEVSVDIKLWPAKDAFRLICNNLPGAKLVIEEICLKVCKVSVSPSVRLAHSSALKLSPARYPFNKVEIRPLSIDKGNSVANFNNIFQGNIPTKMIVGMVSQNNYIGNFNTNPLDFEHFDIQSIGLSVGNESIPAEPYQFNFEENQYMNGLLSLYRCSDKIWDNTDLGLSNDLYRKGLTLIGFNIDPTSPPNLNYLGVPKTGNLNMQITFHKKLPTNVTIIVYAIFPSRVEIDNTRLVTLLDIQQLIDELKQDNDKSDVAPAA